jgi:hypothetical protein
MGFYDSMKIINDFVDRFIEQALDLSPEELEKKTNHDQGYTFLHAIAGYTRDRTVLRDQLVSVLLAGRDTTACTLTWVIYHLSMDPKILAKLRQEIIDTIGLERTPTYEDLKGMKYLQHILNEALRLYPVVPAFNPSESSKARQSATPRSLCSAAQTCTHQSQVASQLSINSCPSDGTTGRPSHGHMCLSTAAQEYALASNLR